MKRRSSQPNADERHWLELAVESKRRQLRALLWVLGSAIVLKVALLGFVVGDALGWWA